MWLCFLLPVPAVRGSVGCSDFHRARTPVLVLPYVVIQETLFRTSTRLSVTVDQTVVRGSAWVDARWRYSSRNPSPNGTWRRFTSSFSPPFFSRSTRCFTV